jgi:hypothetical protein
MLFLNHASTKPTPVRIANTIHTDVSDCVNALMISFSATGPNFLVKCAVAREYALPFASLARAAGEDMLGRSSLKRTLNTVLGSATPNNEPVPRRKVQDLALAPAVLSGILTCTAGSIVEMTMPKPDAVMSWKNSQATIGVLESRSVQRPSPRVMSANPAMCMGLYLPQNERSGPPMAASRTMTSVVGMTSRPDLEGEDPCTAWK